MFSTFCEAILKYYDINLILVLKASCKTLCIIDDSVLILFRMTPLKLLNAHWTTFCTNSHFLTRFFLQKLHFYFHFTSWNLLSFTLCPSILLYFPKPPFTFQTHPFTHVLCFKISDKKTILFTSKSQFFKKNPSNSFRISKNENIKRHVYLLRQHPYM